MKMSTANHGPQRMTHKDCRGPLTFHLVPLVGRTFHSSGISQHPLHVICAQFSSDMHCFQRMNPGDLVDPVGCSHRATVR